MTSYAYVSIYLFFVVYFHFLLSCAGPPGEAEKTDLALALPWDQQSLIEQYAKPKTRAEKRQKQRTASKRAVLLVSLIFRFITLKAQISPPHTERHSTPPKRGRLPLVKFLRLTRNVTAALKEALSKILPKKPSGSGRPIYP